jgi:hypothetical protein
MGDFTDSFWLAVETGESLLVALTALLEVSVISVLMRSTEVSMVGGLGLRRNLEILSIVRSAGGGGGGGGNATVLRGVLGRRGRRSRNARDIVMASAAGLSSYRQKQIKASNQSKEGWVGQICDDDAWRRSSLPQGARQTDGFRSGKTPSD